MNHGILQVFFNIKQIPFGTVRSKTIVVFFVERYKPILNKFATKMFLKKQKLKNNDSFFSQKKFFFNFFQNIYA